MTIAIAAPSSLTHRASPDVHLTVIFTPSDPTGLVEVSLIGDDTPSAARYLELIDAAADRLAVYAQDYRAAAEGDTDMAVER